MVFSFFSVVLLVKIELEWDGSQRKPISILPFFRRNEIPGCLERPRMLSLDLAKSEGIKHFNKPKTGN
jgi:hypothetical protein